MIATVDASTALLALGRLHVVVVHFPIALLLVAAALELVARARASADLERTAKLLLVLGALAAVAAVALGWLHAAQEPLGGGARELLERHRWIGNFAAGFACIAAASLNRRTLRVTATLLAAVLVGVAGHLGGQLVYGADYFVPSRTEFVAPLVPSLASSDTGFAAVAPIFAAHCIECHGELKHKGKLRLDRYDPAWFVPGENDTVITPGAPQSSELARRIALPLDDEDHMPPKKQAQPSPAAIERITAWIAAGASEH